MSVELFVPANFVSTGWGTPTVCVRHGEPAAEGKRIRFVSYTSRWLLLLGVVIYFILVSAQRKTVWAPAWPFCPRCKKEQTTKTAVGWGLLVVGFLLWVAGGVLDPHGVGASGAVPGMLMFVAGIAVAGRGTRLSIAGGVVTDDGVAVRFRRPHEAFANQALAAQRAAARQFAAQQGYPVQPQPVQPQPVQPQPVQPPPVRPTLG